MDQGTQFFEYMEAEVTARVVSGMCTAGLAVNDAHRAALPSIFGGETLSTSTLGISMPCILIGTCK